jgi:hypothetical protein
MEFRKPWKSDNLIIVTSYKSNNFYRLSNYNLMLRSMTNLYLIYRLPETIFCFGIATRPDENLFIYVYSNLYNNKIYINIDFFYIDNSYKISKNKQFQILINEQIINGSLQRIDNDIYAILYNNKYILFSKEYFSNSNFINNILNLSKYYFFDHDIILNSFVFSEFNTLKINIKNLLNEEYSIFQYTLSYNEITENNSFIESKIIEFGSYNNLMLGLIRIYMRDHCFDILIDINKNDIIEISNRLFLNDNDSSIVINNKPSIWFK